MEGLVPMLETLLTRTEVVSAVVLFLMGIIGRANLEKVPFFGVFIRILAGLVDAINSQLESSREVSRARSDQAHADTIEAASSVARLLVEGQEQLKMIGKVDGPTAASEVTQALSQEFHLSDRLARSLTEGAVRELHLP